MRRPPWAATARSLVLVLLWFPSLLLLVGAVLGLVLTAVVLGLPLLRVVLPAVHGLARAHRRLAEHALGRQVPLVAPSPADGRRADWGRLLEPGVWGLGDGGTGVPAREVSEASLEPFRQGWRWLQDPGAWRLLGWLGVTVTGGVALPAAVVLLALAPVAALVLAVVLPLAAGLPAAGVVAVAAGGVLAGAVWWRWGEAVARTGARVDAALLAPGVQERLAQRVVDLAESRAQTVDHAAAELRRIERDLHDGVQARLVSLGLTLGMAAEALDADRGTTRALLQEARGTTRAALADLRALVRGIHPPVLADRGLPGAVEALTLDLAVPVTVVDRLPARAPEPVESAVYFAVAECLANVVKHAGAARATVRLEADGPTLRAVVGDDGVGGADPARGTGLRGTAARLAAFDGTMVVDSPPGGPTVVTLEVPCAWSSPRTSPS